LVIKIFTVILWHEITTTGRFPGKIKTESMDTLETAKQTKTAYFIEYVYPIDAYGKQSFYFQLVRTKDCVILYANENINNVFIACWKMDIPHKDVTIW
jgi:hypothetical protein